MKRFSLLAMTCLMWGSFAGAGLLKVFLDNEQKTLPVMDVQAMKQSSASAETRIYSADGTVIETFSLSSKIPLSFNEIPPKLRDAFMSAEDRNFLNHHGVDYPSVFRAAIRNFMGASHEGGSGITQQVVKNLVVGNQRSLDRKVKEALLATELETMIPKSEIMDIYLNTIWFGHGAYGVGAAAHVWFHKDVSKLNIAEMAFLAGLPKGPALMEPSSHPQRALARRAYVLHNMMEDGYISEDEERAANAEPLPNPVSVVNTGTGHSYYAESVRRTVVGEQGQDAIYSGGMNIRTWQDDRYQAIADKALRDGLLKYDHRHGWGPSIGEVPDTWRKGVVTSCDAKECIVDARDGGHMSDGAVHVENPYGLHGPQKGSIVYFDDGVIVRKPDADGAIVIMSKEGHVLAETGGFWRGHSNFDRATQSKRQVGSIIKPFIALAALPHGWTPDTIVADVPIEIDVDGQQWTPGGDGKDDGMGMIPLKEALAMSRNQAFVRLGMDVGFPEVYDFFRHLGIYDSSQKLSPASMLGATETSLMKMTAAYATLINNSGCPVHPQFTVDEVKLNDCENMVPGTTDIIGMLHGVVSGGTAEHAFMSLPQSLRDKIGGKTGTSNNVLDSWFVGYVGDIIVGVHVGMDIPKSLGEHEFGGTIAAPIAADIISQISE